jgi:hypothetical protein
MKLQGGRELRRSVINPGAGSVVLTAGRLVMNCVFSDRSDRREHRGFW